MPLENATLACLLDLNKSKFSGSVVMLNLDSLFSESGELALLHPDVDIIESTEHINRSVALRTSASEKLRAAEFCVKAADEIITDMKAYEIAQLRLQTAMTLLGKFKL